MAEHVFTGPKPAPRLADLADAQQDLAVRLGPGYRVIKGVAGSGKTVILIERLRTLAAQNPDKAYALFCFNAVLRASLAGKLSSLSNVSVMTIDSYASAECKHHGVAPRGATANSFDAASANALASARRVGASKQFDAVFVDEAQDFDMTRLDLAFEALSSPDGDFVVVRDEAQDVYSRRSARWMPPGRTARGRTRILRTNYRNTEQILQHAHYLMARGEAEVSNEIEPVNPDSILHPLAGRSGQPTKTFRFDSEEDVVTAICDEIAGLIAGGESPDRIAIIGGNDAIRKKLYFEAKQRSIPFVDFSFGNKFAAIKNAAGSVHCASFFRLKGLEYKHVYLVGLDSVSSLGKGQLPLEDLELLRKVVYAAMTRSTQFLTVALSGEGPMVDELAEIHAQLTEYNRIRVRPAGAKSR